MTSVPLEGRTWARATDPDVSGIGPSSMLAEGTRLADRYEILKLLGEGGMGPVYKARHGIGPARGDQGDSSRELAGHPSILQRFKQEIILARKITHRNVIRIFDPGLAEGMRCITMEFVEGRDLSSMARPLFSAPFTESRTSPSR